MGTPTSMQESGHGHFVHHQNHELLHAFVMWSSQGHFELDCFDRTKWVRLFWPHLKRAAKEVMLQVYFDAITKRWSVSSLYTYRSPNSGSRNCAHAASPRADTVRMVKIPVFPRSRIFRRWPTIRGESFLSQNSGYTNFTIDRSRCALQRSRFFYDATENHVLTPK